MPDFGGLNVATVLIWVAMHLRGTWDRELRNDIISPLDNCTNFANYPLGHWTVGLRIMSGFSQIQGLLNKLKFDFGTILSSH